MRGIRITYLILEVVFLTLVISSCGHKLPDSTDATEAQTRPVSLQLKLPFIDTIPDVIFTGESKGSYFSVGLVVNGDLNGDGYADIVIGAPNHNNFRGRVYIYFGGKNISATPDLVITGETKETRLGQRVALGDVNNDGYDDLLTGGWGYKSMQGRAYLYYGGKNFDGTCDKVFEAETEMKSGFGFEVALGDINNDGYADLAIYADAYNSEQGRVYLYYGASGTEMDTTPDKIFDGEQPHSKFGRYLIIGKDVDGDGYGDLLVGAPIWNYEQGRAYLYYGGPGTSMDTTADLTFTGEHHWNRLGRDIGLGDINDDNNADIILAASHANGARGRVYIHLGTTRKNMDTICDLTIEEDQRDDIGTLGVTVAIGDLDNDGTDDLLLGAGNSYNFRGRVYLYYGGQKFDGTYDLVFGGIEANTRFGRFIDVGDVNDDRFPDIVIGSFLYNNCRGRAYLYYGGPRDSEPTQMCKSLVQAAADGDVEQVKSLIEKGANVNGRGKNRNSPLHCSADQGHKDVAELLIRKGADVDSKNALGDTPLHVAAFRGNKNVTGLLINEGANVNARRYFGGTPIHCAVWGGRHQEVTELLFTSGADINARDAGGDTPLHYAAGTTRGGNRKSMVQMLIEKGAAINPTNRLGQTPVDFALTAHAFPVVRFLVTKGAAVSNLLVASAMNDSARASSLIAQGSDVNAKDWRGMNPLSCAIWQGSKEVAELLREKGAKPSIHAAAFLGDIEKVKSFIEAGVDVNTKDGISFTPLHSAAIAGHVNVAKFLIDKGATVRVEPHWRSRTPLYWAIKNKHKDMAKLLINKGADVSSIDLLYYACWYGYRDFVELFIQKGADADSKYWGESPSHYAIWGGYADVLELLLAHGANPNAKDMDGWSLLHYAAGSGSMDMTKMLLDKGAEPNVKEDEGALTPLHCAADKGHAAVAELLIIHDADVNAKDNQGRIPLSLAKEKDHTEIVELLRKHKAKE